MSRHPRPGESTDLQRNAADPEQVKYASRKTRDREARELAAFNEVLASPAGRIVLFAVLRMCRMHEGLTGLEGDALVMAVGRREGGLQIEATCRAADEDGLDLAAREHRAYMRREAAENEASRTAPAREESEQTT